MIEGCLELQISACLFFDMYLQKTGSYGFDVLNLSLRSDWLLRLVQILEKYDAAYVEMMLNQDKTSVLTIIQFKSLLLLLQNIAENQWSSFAIQSARLVETLTRCKFLVTSPLGGADGMVSTDVRKGEKIESPSFYYEIISPCLQVLITLLSVDRESKDHQQSFQAKNLHLSLYNFLLEHSEGLIIPILELRDSSEICLRTVEFLFQIMRMLCQSSCGLPESTKSILKRCSSVCQQYCAGFVNFAARFLEMPDFRGDSSISLNHSWDAVDLYVKILSNLLSIFRSGDYISKVFLFYIY